MDYTFLLFRHGDLHVLCSMLILCHQMQLNSEDGVQGTVPFKINLGDAAGDETAGLVIPLLCPSLLRIERQGPPTKPFRAQVCTKHNIADRLQLGGNARRSALCSLDMALCASCTAGTAEEVAVMLLHLIQNLNAIPDGNRRGVSRQLACYASNKTSDIRRLQGRI